MSDRFLNTKEAATFLRMSEASVRRWSDASLLQVRRVGRRQERRFTEADLFDFLGAGNGVPVARFVAVQPGVNVGGVHVPIHSHFASFYDSDPGRLWLAVPFLCEGLRVGRSCFVIAAGDVLEAHVAALRAQGSVDLDAAIRAGQLVTAVGLGATVEDALDFWEGAFWRVIANGPTVLRVVGEMASERRVFSSDAEMMRYEVTFNLLAKRFPTVTLCQYDVREFNGQILFQAMKAHPDLYGVHLGSFLS